MATSCSSDSCGAPKDFNLSSIEGSDSRFSITHQKCLLCLHFRKVFYCKQCIKSGDFVHSTSHYAERFSEKQVRLLRVRACVESVERRCLSLCAARHRAETCQLELRLGHERAALLAAAIAEAQDNLQKRRAQLEELQSITACLGARLPGDARALEQARKVVASRREELRAQALESQLAKESLKKLQRARLKQLADYVFPVSHVHPGAEHSAGCGSGCTELALAEAARPAGPEGDRVEPPLQLLTACLPLPQDYSAYTHWVASEKGSTSSCNSSGVVQAEPVAHNPVYRITAALAYSAQLLRITAFYLDVRLPFPVSYSEVSSSVGSERRFRRVWCRVQLSANCLLRAIGSTSGTAVEGPRGSGEPPLHVLLRAWPLQLKDEVEEGADRQAVSTDSNEEMCLLSSLCHVTGVGGAAGGELLQLLANDEDDEPDPPEHLQWDWDTVGSSGEGVAPRSPGPAAGSAPSGLMTSAAASIVSIWRGWTTK